MAVKKSRVEVEVDVNDKGSTKKVGLGAKKAGEGLDKVATSAHSADRGLKGAAQASSNGTKNFSKMSQGITGGLVPAYATLAANLFAVSAAFEFLKRAADTRNLRQSQLDFAATTGVALGSITKNIREASGGMLSFQKAAQASAMGLAKGFSPKQMQELTEGARKTSAAMGIGFEEAFDRLVRGVSKAEPELLDELGITLRLADAAEDYGKVINKNAKDLTVAEKGQAVFAKVMGDINKQFGEVEAQENVFVQLGVTFNDIGETLITKMLPAIESFASIIKNNTSSAIAVMGLFAASIIQSISPFEKLNASADRFFQSAKAGFGGSISGIKNVFSGFKESKGTVGAARDAIGGAATSAVGGLERAGTDPILKAAQKKGVFGLTPKQFSSFKKSLKSAEAQLKKHGVVQRGIFAGASKSQMMFFKMAVRANTLSHTKFVRTVNTGFKVIGATAKVTFQGIRLAGTLAFGAVAGAAKLAGGAMNAAMRLAGFVGIAMIAVDAFKAMKNNISTVITKIIDGFVAIAKGGFKVINFFREKFGKDALVFDEASIRGGISDKIYGAVGKVGGMLGADTAGKTPKEIQDQLAAYQKVQKAKQDATLTGGVGAGPTEDAGMSELDKIMLGIKEAGDDTSKVQRNLLNAARTLDFEGMFTTMGIEKMRTSLAGLAEQSPRIAEALKVGTLEAIQNINTEAGALFANTQAIKELQADFNISGASGGDMFEFVSKRNQYISAAYGSAVSPEEVAEIDKLKQDLPTISQMIEQNSRGVQDYLKDAGDAFTNSLSAGLQGLVKGTMTVKEAFKGMASSIISSLAKVASDKIAAQIFGALLDSPFGNLFGGGGTGGGTPAVRYGGVLSNGVKGYSQGGIARGKNAGYPAILHGTEAVVPLPNGKSIPVDVKGARGDQNNIVINISGEGGNAQAQGQGNNSNQQKQIGQAIATAVQQELIKQKRPGGILSPYGAA